MPDEKIISTTVMGKSPGQYNPMRKTFVKIDDPFTVYNSDEEVERLRAELKPKGKLFDWKCPICEVSMNAPSDPEKNAHIKECKKTLQEKIEADAEKRLELLKSDLILALRKDLLSELKDEINANGGTVVAGGAKKVRS